MKIKLDENLPDRIVAGLAALGHDTDTVAGEGLVVTDHKVRVRRPRPRAT